MSSRTGPPGLLVFIIVVPHLQFPDIYCLILLNIQLIRIFRYVVRKALHAAVVFDNAPESQI